MREVKERFTRAWEWESDAQKNWLADYKFSHGDSYNNYQWPDEIRAGREKDEKPFLTVNKTRQHILQIINDAKQNKPSVKYRPVGDDATKEAADVYDGIMRHIEYISKAQIAYDTASAYQVRAGIGFLRVETDYIDDDSFDQEIYIRAIKDPRTVLMDPDAVEADKADMRYCIIYDDIPKDLFASKYPGYVAANANLPGLGDWIDDKHVRLAEYWRKTEFEDELLLMVDPETGERTTARKSKIPDSIWKEVKDDPGTKTRPIRSHKIEQYLIAGNAVVERREWPGIFIPIVPVIGEETVIEKRLDRKGHTRALIDPQKMFNFWVSEATAQVALQTKVPYVADVRAIEGYQAEWRDANRQTLAYLPYNGIDDEGQPIQQPTRSQPPVMAEAYIQGMQMSESQMMMASGQYQSQFGEPSNERSGKAINERQRQGDNATYHYIEGLARAVRQIGRICLDLIPKIYDVRQMVQVLGEDGSERLVLLDPNQKEAYLKRIEAENNTVVELFNPCVGRYDVQADIGPNYSTRRQEAWNAFVQIAAQSPQVMQIAGDLVFRAADFPMAEELADRYKRMIPPGILGDEGVLPPGVQQEIDQGKQQTALLMQENQKLQQQLEQVQSQVEQEQSRTGQERLRLVAKDADKSIQIYKAETERMGVLAQAAGLDTQQIAQVAAQLVLDALHNQIGGTPGADGAPTGAGGASASPLAGAPPQPQGNGQDTGIPPGARQAPDGNHYLPDPNRPGRYMMVA